MRKKARLKMTILKDNYRNHPVHQELDNVLQYIANIKNSESLSDTERDSLLAYEQLLVYAKYVLSNNISQVVPTQLLNNLRSNIRALQNNNLLNIENTYNTYSNIMADLSKIPVFYNKGIVKISLEKLLDNFTNDKEAIKKDLYKEISDFKTKQENEFKSWQVEKENYEKRLKELENENKALANKIAEQTNLINDEKTRLSTISSNFQNNYDQKMMDFQKEFEEKQKEYKESFTEFKNKSSADTEELYQYMEIKKQNVENLWGIIGRASVSGNSQNYANKAKNFAHFMTALALGIMCFAIWSLFEVVKDFIQIKMDAKNVSIDNTFLIIRFVFNIVMFLPAWYCANIANKQRNREFQLRDFEIKTAGLEPFMENMRMIACDKNLNESNKKDETKLELVKDIFQNDLNRKKVDDENIIITKDMLKLINSCFETISKLKEK